MAPVADDLPQLVQFALTRLASSIPLACVAAAAAVILIVTLRGLCSMPVRRHRFVSATRRRNRCDQSSGCVEQTCREPSRTVRLRVTP